MYDWFLFLFQIFAILLVAAVYGAEEKKNEKRGLLGLGYGLSSGYYGHGLGLYNHGIAAPLVSHSVAAPIVSHSVAPVISHSVAAPLYSHGYYGHGIATPVIGHGLSYGYSGYGGYGSYGGYHAPLLGLGHGWHWLITCDYQSIN